MDKHIIGENAGRVWRLLSSDDQRRWEYSEIKDILGLNDAELGSAIGWLAREDKIQFELEHHNSKDEKAYLYLMLNVYFLLYGTVGICLSSEELHCPSLSGSRD